MKRNLPNLFDSKNKNGRTKSGARCRTFETLEDRHMMAVTPISVNPGALTDPSVNGPAVALMAGINSGTLYVRGTNNADKIILRQTNNAITIDGLTGSFNTADFQNIIIRSFGGNDIINLKSEAVKGQQAITKATKIWSGAGADQVTGGRGDDTIYAEDGNDKVWANYGDDIIDGGANDDELHGEAGYDKVFGDLGADKLYGEDNDDYLVGGNDVDYLYGGRGYDHLDGSLGNDYLYGQEDYDYLQDDSALKSDTGSNFLSNNSFVCGWFDRNMLDAQLRSEARADYANNFAISRDEMMSILRAAEDGYTIDATELADLQHLIGNTSVVMPDYVRDLANSVVNGDPANGAYQGTALGNLAAGASSDQLDKLVNKWFLGLDHPSIQYTNSDGKIINPNCQYVYVQGSLFQDGINYTDISQGNVDDCYFLSSLGALADRNPSVIQSMFIDNGDNTFSVRFYHDGVAHYVTVDRYLATDAFGDRVFASFGHDYNDPTNELWVALAEKAYAQLNESGWIAHDGTNSYHNSYGGNSHYTIQQLTGWQAYSTLMYTQPPFEISGRLQLGLTSDQIIDKLNSGKLVCLSSTAAPLNTEIFKNHIHFVTGYDLATGKFAVHNPYGDLPGHPATLYLTWDDITANFDRWDYT